MNITSPWHLSQNDLNLLETCPFQFQQYYWQKSSFIPSLNQLNSGEWGKTFHTLMQQYHLNLPLESILAQHTEFKEPLLALISATQEIWNNVENQQRMAEYPLTLHYQNYIFTTIFDLLILTSEKAIIFDWKTYLQPPAYQIEDNWQTKLYLYVLAEKLNYLPEQISFTYWFVKLPNKPKSYTVSYNQQKHQQTYQQLQKLLTEFEDIVTQENSGETKCISNKNCEKCSYYQLISPKTSLTLNQTQFSEDIPLSLDKIESVII